MKWLCSLLCLTIQLNLVAQYQFEDSTFANNLIIPKLTYKLNKTVESDINQILVKLGDSLMNEEYCLSNYGYIQKNNLLQFEFMYNCDFENDHFLFWYYNVRTGVKLEPNQLILEEKLKAFFNILNESASDNTATKLSEVKLQFLQEGLKVYYNQQSKSVILPWSKAESILNYL